MLNAALDNIKVVRQAYHGNVMVGNHCHIVLKHFTMLTRVLGDRDDELLFNEIFGLCKDITMLMSAPRFLNDQEIDRLEELCFLKGISQEKYMNLFSGYQNLFDNFVLLVY